MCIPYMDEEFVKRRNVCIVYIALVMTRRGDSGPERMLGAPDLIPNLYLTWYCSLDLYIACRAATKIRGPKYCVRYYADILICMSQNGPPDEMASSLKPEQYGDICSLRSPPEIY